VRLAADGAASAAQRLVCWAPPHPPADDQDGFGGDLSAAETSEPNPRHKIYPYLLRHLAIERPNQVWCADITYIQMRRGFLYLVAIMDWASRKVLAWRLSNTMIRSSALRRWRRQSLGTAAPISSTLIKARSLGSSRRRNGHFYHPCYFIKSLSWRSPA
jgi:transposase InsO family protein